MDVSIIIAEAFTGNRFDFPMLPERISCSCGTLFQSYDVMKKGEVLLPRGAALTEFSWSGILPGKALENESFVSNWMEPEEIQSLWSVYKVNGTLLNLMVTGTPINHFVYLKDYNVEYSGSFGNYNYDISFIEARDMVVHTVSELGMNPVASENKNEAEPRPEPPQPETYTVKEGDTLWGIAQCYLGDGSKYPQIYELNTDKISDPHWIYPGQILIMP